MGGVFICYRRRDAPGSARAIYERVKSIFGKQNVFFDVEDSEAGSRWKETLAIRVSGCDALLAIIGPNWNPLVDGKRRLDDPDDQVRFELVTAFARSIPVIPVLVEGATVPTASRDLPKDLKPLFEWQTIDVIDTHYEDAIARLTSALSSILEKRTATPVPVPPTKLGSPAPEPPPSIGSWHWPIAGAVVGVVLLGALMKFWLQPGAPPVINSLCQ